ncbi:MAG: flap endonuclease-1 [Candidatus Nezhaarchaeota archaeon]|nr:flap endonuclease-1 [Candidatus Nezhaarchaeota archaeon]
MGARLSKLVVKEVTELGRLRGKRLAVDASNVLYQFLALIRKPDGTLLTDPRGRVTSHLVGLAFRSTRLLYDYDIDLVFVFDGPPPSFKREEVAKRKSVRERALIEWREALSRGDFTKAFSKAVVSGALTRDMVEDSKRLLKLLGIPYVEAPSEGEAQAAFMVAKGDAWAVGSQDFDSLLFGSPRLVRYVTIQGTEFLPSKGVVKRLKPEVIELQATLSYLGLSRDQLIDIAILTGTDFNRGIRGVGPLRAFRLIKAYGGLESIPSSIRSQLPSHIDEVKEFFLNPPVTHDYSLDYCELNAEGLKRFLCDERGFAEDRVDKLIKRMEGFRALRLQAKLSSWT